jgi:hypothetical protein
MRNRVRALSQKRLGSGVHRGMGAESAEGVGIVGRQQDSKDDARGPIEDPFS